MYPAWSRELLRIFALFSVATVIGLALDEVFLLFTIALAVYLAWHLYNIYLLDHWLRLERKANPPESTGIWGEIFHQYYHMQRRYRSRKKRLAALLREFRESTTAMPDATVVLDANGDIEWFNSSAEEMLGLRVPQDVGQRIENLVRMPVFAHYLAKEEFNEPLEMASPIKEGVHLGIHVVPYGRGQKLILARDITRLRKMESMRREFVANASHELRSPLTVISGYLEALTDDQQMDEQWRKPLLEMHNQAERMSGIIDDLLELSRLETEGGEAGREEVDVRGLVTRIREDALAVGREPTSISLELESRTRILGSEKELYSAFSNLIFNSIRYTPEDGHISVTWRDDGEQAVLDVVDTGIGIAPEHLSRITERFFRVDPSRVRSKGGTGLGLAIVKHVMQRHGGNLEIDSELGKGSRFSCRFPASRCQSIESLQDTATKMS